ncbi:MAG: YdeI/OmpD-associated family protein [Bacteroidales bacterium]|jgi:uncharacterized protein YdeI (YjbR/CyaY-like superfamily)|nr:YdeI/OmpD-associated family protein [Bacteroidales bacterium]
MNNNGKTLETFCPSNRDDWRNWLINNHKDNHSVWVVFYKASSGKSNLTWSDAVEEALCFGWIDSTKKSIDNERFMQYFSHRKPQSTWSRVNKDKVKLLINEGLMTPSGLKVIERAKQDGSWTILDSVESLTIPDCLEAEFSKYKGSKEFFMSLSKSVKKGLLYWVISAKRTDTKQKRAADIANSAAQHLKPKQFR